MGNNGPENRHLLRVKLDDAEQADKDFPNANGNQGRTTARLY